MEGTSEKRVFNLEKYHIDPEIGFLLRDPLKFLPPHFDHWNKLAMNMPDLVKEKKFRLAVHKLPLLDQSALEGHRELMLAHLQLSILTAGYVWQEGDAGAARVLPRCLAVPFSLVSRRLGIPPVLSHTTMVLANVTLADPQESWELSNLRCMYNISERHQSNWFFIITALVELVFAKCVKPIFGVLEETNNLDKNKEVKSSPDAIHENTEMRIVNRLNEVTAAIKEIQEALSKMHEKLTPDAFFNGLRPFLAGWGGEDSPLPDGLVYEGISDRPTKLAGGSGAQSPALQILDAFLGVEHAKERRAFIVRMREYMLPEHRSLLQDLDRCPHKIRDFVMTSGSSALEASYNDCLSALVKLRTYHIGIVAKFVIMPSKQCNTGDFKSLDNMGTGGTGLVDFLRDIRNTTRQQWIVSDKEKQPTGFVRELIGYPRVMPLSRTKSAMMLLVTAALLTAVLAIFMANAEWDAN